MALLAMVSAFSVYALSASDIQKPFDEFLDYAEPNNQVEEFDLNNDGILENYKLENGRIIVTQSGTELWRSKTEWWIDSFVFADATHDGKSNLVLSLWKSGNYGSSQPFWEEENDSSVKNHLFVLEYDDLFKMVWGSSNLSVPNCKFIFSDINNDNLQELLVIEGEYKDDFSCSGKYLAVWKWQEWGFYNEWRSESGHYQDFSQLLDDKPINYL